MTRRELFLFNSSSPSRGRLTRRTSVAFIVAGLATGVAVPVAAEDDMSIHPDEVLIGEPDAVVTVATEVVPADLVGAVCDLRITTENGASVHPGNAVLTSTGDQRFVTPGVEDSAEGRVATIESVTLGETLTVQLQLGADGVSSLGFTIAVDCPEPEPEPTQVTAPPAAVETPTTTTAPPLESTAPPTVLPVQQENPLPPADPANPVTATPTFTG